MSVINRLAASLGRRDEGPNQELARDLVAKKDQAGMTALAEAAKADPDAVFKQLDEIQKAKETGSVITVDNAISSLAYTAAANDKYKM